MLNDQFLDLSKLDLFSLLKRPVVFEKIFVLKQTKLTDKQTDIGCCTKVYTQLVFCTFSVQFYIYL